MGRAHPAVGLPDYTYSFLFRYTVFSILLALREKSKEDGVLGWRYKQCSVGLWVRAANRVAAGPGRLSVLYLLWDRQGQTIQTYNRNT